MNFARTETGTRMIKDLHHIQIAIPVGGEDEARGFYSGILGFAEVEKPVLLRTRGGLWLETASVRLHLGVEDPFLPAKKAHPGFSVHNLEDVKTTLAQAGIEFRRDIDLPGMTRIYISDPFGNRIELLETQPD